MRFSSDNSLARNSETDLIERDPILNPIPEPLKKQLRIRHEIVHDSSFVCSSEPLVAILQRLREVPVKEGYIGGDVCF